MPPSSKSLFGVLRQVSGPISRRVCWQPPRPSWRPLPPHNRPDAAALLPAHVTTCALRRSDRADCSTNCRNTCERPNSSGSRCHRRALASSCCRAGPHDRRTGGLAERQLAPNTFECESAPAFSERGGTAFAIFPDVIWGWPLQLPITHAKKPRRPAPSATAPRAHATLAPREVSGS